MKVDQVKVDQAILSVTDLTKVYGSSRFPKRAGQRALDGVSLEVPRGTVFGLLGPNGAGKTTLIKVLLGLVRGHGGSALIFGEPPGNPASRRRVGYLPEAHRLPGYLTGRQVLQLFGMMAGADPAAVAKRVDPLLDQVGVLKSADRKIREYSKGMQQRVGLAQALIHEPEVIFLDEPTDGVDPVGRARIREMVLDLKNRGATIFINSHLLMEVELICDRVVIMSQGKIIREGTIDELTPETGSVRVELARMPDDLTTLLAGLGKELKLDGNAFGALMSEAELNEAIDRLRKHDVAIRAVTPRRLSLEEYFIDLVQKKEPWS